MKSNLSNCGMPRGVALCACFAFALTTPGCISVAEGPREAGPNEIELDRASQYGDVAAARAAIARGARIDTRVLGYTPLQTAIMRGHSEIARLLIASGANVRRRANNDSTPLMEAAFDGRVEIMKMLLDNGAPVDDRDQHGQTALIRARRVPAASLLIDYGADVNARDKEGKSSLMEADGELTGFLLEKGADPDLRDRHDWTALMWASFNGQRDAAMKLIKGRAALDLACKSGFPTQGWTALFFASATGRAEIVQELLANGANANVRESFGRTALMTAAAHGFTVGSEKGYCRVVLHRGSEPFNVLAPCDGFVKVARLLVAKGADVTPRDRNGHDALNYAKQSGDHPIVALLEKRP